MKSLLKVRHVLCLIEVNKLGFLDKKEFTERFLREKEFTPPGNKIYEYELIETPDQTYEVINIYLSILTSA